MKIGRIEYLNLLPFFVFLKQSPLTAATKQFAHNHHSYPAKLNADYLFRRIDSGFISSFAARKQRLSCAGIVGRGKVQSVLAIIGERGEDYQSATSNALLQALGISGRVLSGERELAFFLANDHREFLELAASWFGELR
ncbi:MAG: menaquinone biosynthesis protein, partial [Helicobacter sp.]|nr:menaquinone biosynthesis protein [Helicobacter sp.]